MSARSPLVWAWQAVPALLLIIIWQVAVDMRPGWAFQLGSPRGITERAWADVLNWTLLSDMGVTCVEAFLGFSAGVIIGTILGFMLAVSVRTEFVSRPYLAAVGALPVFALGPVIIFWFGTGILSKTVLGFLCTFAVAAVQAYIGVSRTDPTLLRLVRAAGGSRRQEIFMIMLPASLLWVMAGARMCIGMALLGAFIGEFLASNAGLGYRITVAEGLFDVNGIWVGVGGMLLLALVFQKAMSFVEDHALWLVQRIHLSLEKVVHLFSLRKP